MVNSNSTGGNQTYSLSGQLTPAAAGNGATVNISGLASNSATADSSGKYAVTGLPNGTYTVTPSHSGYSFTPASQSITINGADVSVPNFTGSSQTFSISGTITGASGASVNLSGTSSATTTVDGSGNFTFTNLANGNYTVTPNKSGFSFTPANKAVTVNNANISGVNFTATATQTFSLSGTITGGSGATVKLSGASSATTTADGSGNFSFSGLPNGNFTATPSKTGLSFIPANKAVTINNANVTGVNFTTTVQTFGISGTITGGSGATVTLSGAANAATTANGSGSFTFSALTNGSYIVTPSHAGFTFSPTSKAVTIGNANVTGTNFTATALTYSIAGAISGAGNSGATVTLSGSSSATGTTSTSGSFSFTGLINGNYAVVPSKSGFVFSPSTQAVSINGSNITNLSFTSSVAPPTYAISGTISPASVGSGVTVTLSGGASAVTTANASGNFNFTSLNNGSYTVSPTSSGGTFSPSSQNVTINNANVTGVNFTGTATSNVIFFDDFTASTLDTTQWVAMNRAGDYSNSEQECYSPSQVTLTGGNLVLTTVAQTSTCGDSTHSPGQFPFLSGYIQWKTFNFTYGTVEFRAKTAGGRGSWPAVWMLGSDCQASNVASADNVGACNWPNPGSDEIDIVEMSDNNYISVGHNMFVSSGGQSCFQNTSSDTSQNWHVYTMTWKPGSVTFAIDGTAAGCSHTQNVPTTPMFLIINNAIAPSGAGSNWPVVPSDFPQTMQVDYVKVTQP